MHLIHGPLPCAIVSRVETHGQLQLQALPPCFWTKHCRFGVSKDNWFERDAPAHHFLWQQSQLLSTSVPVKGWQFSVSFSTVDNPPAHIEGITQCLLLASKFLKLHRVKWQLNVYASCSECEGDIK